MSNLKEFYKVDQLNAEIRDLKKKVKELEAKIKELEDDGGPPEIHSANAVI